MIPQCHLVPGPRSKVPDGLAHVCSQMVHEKQNPNQVQTRRLLGMSPKSLPYQIILFLLLVPAPAPTPTHHVLKKPDPLSSGMALPLSLATSVPQAARHQPPQSRTTRRGALSDTQSADQRAVRFLSARTLGVCCCVRPAASHRRDVRRILPSHSLLEFRSPPGRSPNSLC